CLYHGEGGRPRGGGWAGGDGGVDSPDSHSPARRADGGRSRPVDQRRAGAYRSGGHGVSGRRRRQGGNARPSGAPGGGGGGGDGPPGGLIPELHRYRGHGDSSGRGDAGGNRPHRRDGAPAGGKGAGAQGI